MLRTNTGGFGFPAGRIQWIKLCFRGHSCRKSWLSLFLRSAQGHGLVVNPVGMSGGSLEAGIKPSLGDSQTLAVLKSTGEEFLLGTWCWILAINPNGISSSEDFGGMDPSVAPCHTPGTKMSSAVTTPRAAGGKLPRSHLVQCWRLLLNQRDEGINNSSCVCRRKMSLKFD